MREELQAPSSLSLTSDGLPRVASRPTDAAQPRIEMAAGAE